METTLDDAAEQARATGRKVGKDFSENVGDIKAIASDEIKSLIADVEDLITRISDMKDADVVRIRTKVTKAVSAAKEKLAGGAETLRRQAQGVASTADDYVHDSPWAAVGVAALVGAVVGVLVARR